jgi:DNA-binding response OmpR family regulator
MIAEYAPSFHPMASHRILYVGQDITLLQTLAGALEDRRVVRCPGGSLEYALIESEICYSLLLLDEELPGPTGLELAQFARGVRHREGTPIIILSAGKTRCDIEGVFLKKPDNLKLLVTTIRNLLVGLQ